MVYGNEAEKSTSSEVDVDINLSSTTPIVVPKPHSPVGSKSVYEILMSSEGEKATHTLFNAYSDRFAYHRPVTNNEKSSFETHRLFPLPYFLPWSIQSGRQLELPPDFTWLSSSCGGRAVVGVIGGGAMGLLMGVFLGAMSDATPPVQVIAGKDVPQAPLREQMRTTMRSTANKSIYWCRNFAFISGVFGGSECLVEKYRGKHDVWNSVASGCITGAALQISNGPQAAAVGCCGFAAFSLVIDSFMGHY